MGIVAGVASLIQYAELIKNEDEMLRPDRCHYCGRSHPWRHGPYPRKADRTNTGDNSLNPILIQRYYCPDCRRTFSVLPECIPPKRWYLWDVQQATLLLLLAGKSFSTAAKELMPSRHTIKRWLTSLKEKFHLHKDVLCNQFVELGRAINFSEFWQTFFKNNLLSTAMCLCDVAGVPIP